MTLTNTTEIEVETIYMTPCLYVGVYRSRVTETPFKFEQLHLS